MGFVDHRSINTLSTTSPETEPQTYTADDLSRILENAGLETRKIKIEIQKASVWKELCDNFIYAYQLWDMLKTKVSNALEEGDLTTEKEQKFFFKDLQRKELRATHAHAHAIKEDDAIKDAERLIRRNSMSAVQLYI